MNTGMSKHQCHKMKTDEWLTPPNILDDLGPFDLDPCAPINRPWAMAKNHYTVDDDGLKKEWFGCVWCNPPYGTESPKWLDKLATHNNGIALIFARTETEMFFTHVWKKANALMFIKGRLYFHHVNGDKARFNSGAPSVLIAYGDECVERLKNTKIQGQLIILTSQSS